MKHHHENEVDMFIFLKTAGIFSNFWSVTSAYFNQTGCGGTFLPSLRFHC
jgi:hypothetical protein